MGLPRAAAMHQPLWSAVLIAVLLLTNLGRAHAGAQVQVATPLKLEDGSQGVYTVLKGAPQWRLFPNLWVDKSVALRWQNGKASIVAPKHAMPHWHPAR